MSKKADLINPIKICLTFFIITFSYDPLFYSYYYLMNFIYFIKYPIMEYFCIIFYRYLRRIIVYIINNMMEKDFVSKKIYNGLFVSNNIFITFISLYNFGNFIVPSISNDFYITYINLEIKFILEILKYFFYVLFIMIIFNLKKNNEYKKPSDEDVILI